MKIKDFVTHLEGEVIFLREQVKDLQEKLHAISGATAKLNDIKTPAAPIHALNELTGKIESMQPLTEDEEKEKQAAMDELLELENVSGSFN